MTFRHMEISAYITFSKRVVKEVVRRVDVESDFEGQGLKCAGHGLPRTCEWLCRVGSANRTDTHVFGHYGPLVCLALTSCRVALQLRRAAPLMHMRSESYVISCNSTFIRPSIQYRQRCSHADPPLMKEDSLEARGVVH
ncbi:hypothetical protein BKA82DRAFT_815056 [Pisolithus tinctorius]|uniref:Uncharacterized protein n=1 Tax=Pisolithus tinctorius Marx 270 TaxID=870435 RepID=A0A0C3N1I9_PISTI|nr:hypothetical protein BKA82DRAFT_815056 [Pisolithus tinctorius]KIN94939.1 hypothetical protein M404DRAFT_336855 [Pisolithus tinctorius Marx 270]